jgi:hypothetical protein
LLLSQEQGRLQRDSAVEQESKRARRSSVADETQRRLGHEAATDALRVLAAAAGDEEMPDAADVAELFESGVLSLSSALSPAASLRHLLRWHHHRLGHRHHKPLLCHLQRRLRL